MATEPTKETTLPNPLDPTRGALAAFISNLVSNIGLSGLAIYLVLVQLPQMQTSFMEELKAEREVREIQTRELTKAISDLANEVKEIKKQ